MSHLVLETRWLFLLKIYVWFILTSYIFKMTYVNNLGEKKGNCLWSGSCTQLFCFKIFLFFITSFLLALYLYYATSYQGVLIGWNDLVTVLTKWYRKKWFFNVRLIYYLWGIKKPWTNVQTPLLFATGCQFYISEKNIVIAKTSWGRQFSWMEKPELR